MILDNIVASKRRELIETKKEQSLQNLLAKIDAVVAVPTRSFKEALRKDGMSLIAELKKASPSAGIICSDFDPVKIGRIYEQSGASAISVLTETRYFLGALEFLLQIREVVSIPILRKDFIFDEYQVYESKANGADAILLIAAILTDKQLYELISLAHRIGLDALVEVHTEEELRRVLRTEAQIIGINNRDLKTFKVDLATTTKLAPIIIKNDKMDKRVIVSESGIRISEDVRVVAEAGADAILVGEALMRGGGIRKKVKELLVY